MTELRIASKSRVDLIDITAKVQASLSIKDGLLLVYVPHATAGIFINENEPNLLKDIKKFLSNLVPQGNWAHDCQENNADSHIKEIILGHSAVIPVENSKMQLGTWQSIFLAELDGPRTRTVITKEIKG